MTHLPRRLRAPSGALSYANVMSTIAVFGVLAGGGAYAASQIKAGDIKKNAVHSKHIKKGAVKTPELADGAVTDEKLAGGGEGVVASVAAGGDLTGFYPDPEIRSGRVGPDELAGDAIPASLFGGSPKIADNAVAGSEVANESLTGQEIFDDSLTRKDLLTVAKAEVVDSFDEPPPASRCTSNQWWGGLAVTITGLGSRLWYCGDVRGTTNAPAWIPLAHDSTVAGSG